MARTHYQVLGVTQDASSVDIAAAYREKRDELKAKGSVAPESLELLNEAYRTLADPGRRQEYDENVLPRPRIVRAATQDQLVEEAHGASPWIKFGVPVALVAIAFFGWRASHKPKAPEARIATQSAMADQAHTLQLPDRVEREVPQAALAAPVAAAGSMSASAIFQAVSPSVVRVLSGDDTGPKSQGSGVVVGSGEVITNCHVVEGGSVVKVKSGSSVLSASVTVEDKELDLCRLSVSGLGAPAVTIAGVGELQTGERVYAIGAPRGLELTISEGIVSSLRESANGKIVQTTAAVSPGSSGGGLFDAQGRLVGIVTFQRSDGQNLNFALPADWIADMRSRGPTRVARASTTSAEPTIAEMVVGNWYCFGSLSGRNGEYTYGSDGVLRLSLKDGGPKYAVNYQVYGRNIAYTVGGKGFSLAIETITQARMVQLLGDGERMSCDRR
jgi:serine protease Do